MSSKNPDLKPCTRCKTGLTTLRVDGEPVCSTCKAAIKTKHTMEYMPISEEKKPEWIKWLESQVSVLSGKQENRADNRVFETPDGDVATGKDLVGNLLALLTNKNVTIP